MYCPKIRAYLPRRTLSVRGFTLIELIVVIVILGILAATAMPKYMDMRREARFAAAQGMAGALRSGIVMAKAAAEHSLSTYFLLADGTTRVYFGNLANGVMPGFPTATLQGIGALMGCEPVTGLTCQGFEVKGSYNNGMGSQQQDESSGSGPMLTQTIFFFPPGASRSGNCNASYNPVTATVSLSATSAFDCD